MPAMHCQGPARTLWRQYAAHSSFAFIVSVEIRMLSLRLTLQVASLAHVLAMRRLRLLKRSYGSYQSSAIAEVSFCA